MSVNDEGKIGKETIVMKFKVISWHLSRGAKTRL